MAKKAKTQMEFRVTIPTFEGVTERFGRFGQDLGSVVDKVGQQAADFIPETSRKQFDRLRTQVGEVQEDVTGLADSVRSDIENRWTDLAGQLDEQVATLTKRVTKRRKQVVKSVEKEARKQVERAFKRLRLPVRGEIDALKRRMTSIERKLDAILKQSKRPKTRRAA